MASKRKPLNLEEKLILCIAGACGMAVPAIFILPDVLSGMIQNLGGVYQHDTLAIIYAVMVGAIGGGIWLLNIFMHKRSLLNNAEEGFALFGAFSLVTIYLFSGFRLNSIDVLLHVLSTIIAITLLTQRDILDDNKDKPHRRLRNAIGAYATNFGIFGGSLLYGLVAATRAG